MRCAKRFLPRDRRIVITSARRGSLRPPRDAPEIVVALAPAPRSSPAPRGGPASTLDHGIASASQGDPLGGSHEEHYEHDRRNQTTLSRITFSISSTRRSLHL